MSRLKRQRVKSFSMVREKFTHLILEKVKYNPDWDNPSTSYNPLEILVLIKKTVLAQTED